MGKGIDLELIRGILQDDRLHIGMATVDRVTVADDMSYVAIECTLQPEGRQMIVTEAWNSVGADSGHGDLPDPKDLLIVVMADGDPDHAFSIGRLASQEEALPKQIKDGHFVSKAKPGKKYFLASDTRVEIGKGDPDAPAEEPLVLGLVLKQFLSDTLTQLKQLSDDVKTIGGKVNDLGTAVNSLATTDSTHTHNIITPAPGSPTTPPLTALAQMIQAGVDATTAGMGAKTAGDDAGDVKSALDDLKSSPVEDDKVLSDLAFTEKGS